MELAVMLHKHVAGRRGQMLDMRVILYGFVLTSTELYPLHE